MLNDQLDSTVAITRTEGILVITMQSDLDSKKFDAMRTLVLEQVTLDTVDSVVLDFSAVDVLSLVEFDRIRAFLGAVRLLGADTVIVSLSAGVVLYLTEVNALTDGIRFFLGLDEALQWFRED